MLSKELVEKLEVFGTSRPSYSFEPDWGDLEFLYNEIVKGRPYISLELGSGFSTVVIWEALKEVGTGHLISLEADPFWHQQNVQGLHRLYKDNLPAVVFSPVTNLNNGSVMEYSFNPLRAHPEKIDFIYVDGPTLHSWNKVIAEPLLFAGAAETIVVDGRKAQVESMSLGLAPMYKIELDEVNFRTVFRKKAKG